MASQYETSDFRNGIKVLLDGQPYIMTYFQFVKPGKGTAFTRTKLKHMINGSVIERTFRTGEILQAADCEEVPVKYSYVDDDHFHFMHIETFEDLIIEREAMDGAEDFLTDELECSLMLYNGKPVQITLPNFIDAVITYCEPGAKGNTATGVSKPATISTGATIPVPLFVNEGDKIRVDTRTRSYVSRV